MKLKVTIEITNGTTKNSLDENQTTVVEIEAANFDIDPAQKIVQKSLTDALYKAKGGRDY